MFHFPILDLPSMVSEEIEFRTLSEFVAFYSDLYKRLMDSTIFEET